MVVGILPVLTEGPTGNFTRSRLFDEYMRQAFDKENARLLVDQDGHTGGGFLVPAFEAYCQALALTILAGNTPNLTTLQQLPLADEVVRKAAPTVRPSAGTVSFAHKSMWEYFAARSIIQYLDVGAGVTLLPFDVVADHGVLDFLQEMVTPAMALGWEQDLVLGSKDHAVPDLPERAAAALTVLCALHRGLSGRSFAGVRVPGACLMGAYLYNSDFRGADLTGVDLRNADLRGVQLQRACMHKVQQAFNHTSHHSPCNPLAQLVATGSRRMYACYTHVRSPSALVLPSSICLLFMRWRSLR
jgi:hypothetical protein